MSPPAAFVRNERKMMRRATPAKIPTMMAIVLLVSSVFDDPG